VINQSLVGVVLEARRHKGIDRVYGARHGVRGIVNEDFVDLTQETSHNLELVAATPGSALGSTRDKPDLAYCTKIFQVLRAHGIGHFFYIGGNDSSDTVRIVSQQAQAAGYPLRCIHIPKTIDNDLVGNDHTPGFPSAARFVAQAFAGANLDNAALPGVYLAVVMGRHAGFLTAASALGKKFPDDGPHLIYLPERTFVLEQFLDDVRSMHQRHGRCVIAVSEGIHDASGTPVLARLAQDLERDAHGNVQLSGTGALADLLCEEIKQKLGIKRVRGDTFGYLQRSFIGCVSDVDQREAREVGEKAVQYAMWGDRDGSVAIQRTGYYSVDYSLLPLDAVAGKTRVMDDAFISASGTDVTDAFRLYLRPLLGSGLTDAYRLRPAPVAKVLGGAAARPRGTGKRGARPPRTGRALADLARRAPAIRRGRAGGSPPRRGCRQAVAVVVMALQDDDYRPADTLSLWWTGDPAWPVLIGELGMVRASRGVSLRYATSWLAAGFALSEDLPRRLGPLPGLTDVAQVREVDAVVAQWKAHFATAGVRAADIESLAQQIDRPYLADQRRGWGE
jgi:6-phosphofructokinase